MAEPLSTPPPDKLVIVASTHDADASRQSLLAHSEDEIKLVETASGWFSRRSYHCGHQGPKWFRINVYGIKSKEIRQKKDCPDCYVARVKCHVIRCALCRLPIFPGEGVAIYDSNNPRIQRDVAAYFDGHAVFGCLRWDCCPTGGFFAGYWTEEGFRPYDFEKDG